MYDAQTVQGQEFIHRAYAGTLRRYQRGKAAGRNNLRAHGAFLLNPAHDAVDQTDIAVEYSGLYGIDRIAPDHFLRFDDLDARQFGCALDQPFERDPQPRGDRTADVLALL